MACKCVQDYVDQLKLIIKVLGPPSEDDLSFINSSKARAYIRALPQQEVSRHVHLLHSTTAAPLPYGAFTHLQQAALHT